MRKMLVAGVGFLALAVPVMAQTVPAELAGTARDVTFLKMPASGNSCAIGVRRLTKGGKGVPMCLLSINQCLTAAHGTIAKDQRGEWGCKAAGG